MIEVQRDIREKAVFDDDFDSLDVFCGVDQAFIGREKVVSAAVSLYGDLSVFETSFGVREIEVPYIPGLLAFREAPSALDAVGRLDCVPDLLLVDGSGSLHPRKAGMATHIGVELDIPSIGVTKNLLSGEVQCMPESVGDSAPVFLDGEVLGYCFLSKERCNPIYVSSGHRVSPETAVDLVKRCLDGYKLPEPIRYADKLAGEKRDELK